MARIESLCDELRRSVSIVSCRAASCHVVSSCVSPLSRVVCLLHFVSCLCRGAWCCVSCVACHIQVTSSVWCVVCRVLDIKHSCCGICQVAVVCRASCRVPHVILRLAPDISWLVSHASCFASRLSHLVPHAACRLLRRVWRVLSGVKCEG